MPLAGLSDEQFEFMRQKLIALNDDAGAAARYVLDVTFDCRAIRADLNFTAKKYARTCSDPLLLKVGLHQGASLGAGKIVEIAENTIDT